MDNSEDERSYSKKNKQETIKKNFKNQRSRSIFFNEKDRKRLSLGELAAPKGKVKKKKKAKKQEKHKPWDRTVALNGKLH